MNEPIPVGSKKSKPKIGILASLAFDELFRFEGNFKSALYAEALHKLSVCFVTHKESISFGGIAGNIAYSLALLQEKAWILGRLGEDGVNYKQHLANSGMNVSYLEIAKGDSPRAYILTDEEENQLAHYSPGVSSEAAPPFVLPSEFQAEDFLLVGPESKHRMLEALAQGIERKLRVYFAPGQMTHVFSKKEWQKILPDLAGLVMNEYEWKIFESSIYGEEETYYPPLILVTQGAEGIHMNPHGQSKFFPVPEKIAALNPTGAGDAFLAGLLAGLANDFSIETSVESGQILAAACVRHHHPQGQVLTALQKLALEKLGWSPQEALN